ncbi:MAG: winged helix-turn-helix domain-containing protein, partial [Proteobacteria bacterium]|nr:winged helix-turn-helix domain-containing protein [Pseudomonadota bacterium]
MTQDPYITTIASLIGDPARANMLLMLMDGRAFTAKELAYAGGVSAQTASGHLAKLTAGGLISVVKQGRHKYFRLASSEVADVIESLAVIS